MTSPFSGLSAFVWKVKDAVSPHPSDSEVGRQYLLDICGYLGITPFIKVADGVSRYNLRPTLTGWKDDILPLLFDLLAKNYIPKVGWHYLYGTSPETEAEIASARINQFGLEGYVFDPEGEYKNRFAQATRFINRFRQLQPDIPVALCSYRYPVRFHSDFPWKEFSAGMVVGRDCYMPQVYWEQNPYPNAGYAELAASYIEYQDVRYFKRGMDFIPIFPMYSRNGWTPTEAQLDSGKVKGKELNLKGVGYWAIDDQIRTLDTAYPAMNTSRGYWDAIWKDGDWWNRERIAPEPEPEPEPKPEPEPEPEPRPEPIDPQPAPIDPDPIERPPTLSSLQKEIVQLKLRVDRLEKPLLQ